MWHKIVRRGYNFFYKPWCLYIISRGRWYRYKTFSIYIRKGVFHPGLFYSTHFLLDELERENLTGKTLLELGAGSGLISFQAAVNGAEVTATDVSTLAIEGLQDNLSHLRNTFPSLQMHILYADLFDGIPVQPFDYIIINPPYYPRKPKTEAEFAWYCGEEFEYFENLFSALSRYMQPSTRVWMSMSEDCNVLRIQAIADRSKLALQLKSTRYYMGEKNMIYQIVQHKM